MARLDVTAPPRSRPLPRLHGIKAWSRMPRSRVRLHNITISVICLHGADACLGSIKRCLNSLCATVGELEGWLQRKQIKASKQKKAEWANEADERIKSLGSQSGDVWDFVKKVATFLQNECAVLDSAITLPTPQSSANG